MSKTVNSRTTEYPIDDIFLERYSPRAMSGEHISTEELMALFEAARWAPSSKNRQPWKFIYAKRDTPDFEKFLGLLEEGNRAWCIRAGVLIVVVSKTTKEDGSFSRTHSLDTGSAWENLALQASQMGVVCHGMAGFDYDRAKEELSVPEEYAVEMMIAIGKPGRIQDLPDHQQPREKPTTSKPLEEIVFEGKFTA